MLTLLSVFGPLAEPVRKCGPSANACQGTVGHGYVDILGRVPPEYDAIIVGGGHNGLATAAYLGRAGLKTLVLERRDVLGGAAVSEHPWPGYTVSTLSYGLSLMPPEVIRELELRRHGLTLYPLAADYYVPFPDGSHLLLTKDAAQAKAEIGKFSKKDAQVWPAFSEYLAKIARLVRPLLLVTPPTVGAKAPQGLLELAQFAWKLKGLDVKTTGDFVKVMTLSVAELLDEWFDSPQVKAARCVSGAIGTYGGPYTPGTAYVLLHHYIGEIDGQMAEWAFVRGGTGAVSQAIAADATESGRPSAAPYCDGVLPTIIDDSRAPAGKDLMSCFTQYVPASWSQAPHRDELEAYADRVVDGYARFAPNLKGAIEHRQVLGPHDMEQEFGLIGGNIMHGDLTLDQLFSWRPVAGYGDYRTPIKTLYLCGSGTHPGGGISGINGRNASREILKALRRTRSRK